MKRNHPTRRALVALLLAAALLLSCPIGAMADDGSDAFLEAYAAISDATGLEDKWEAIEYAQSLQSGADASDPAVAAAIAALEALAAQTQETIAACEAYIDYVYAAMDAFEANGSYETIQGYILSADELQDKIDGSYGEIGTVRGLLAGLSSKMYEIKYECTGYLNAMLRFVNAGTYSAMNTALASLANAERNYAKNAYPEISESFPGLAEARELVLEKKEEMSGILAQSTAFVAAVTNIGTDGVLTLELAAAIEERDKTDLTVPDAATAKKTLDRYLAMYEGARSFGAEEFSFWLSFAVAG